MANLVLTFEGSPVEPITIDETTSFQTPGGVKLGSELVVGDGFGLGTVPVWWTIASITPEV